MNPIDKLINEREKINLFIELADIYGGKINSNGVEYSKDQLKEELQKINIEIEQFRSTQQLKLIKREEIMAKENNIFEEKFYQTIQSWQKKTKIMIQEVPVIKAEFEKFIQTNLRPIDRTILYNELFLTVGGHLTDDGLKMLVRLETWSFKK